MKISVCSDIHLEFGDIELLNIDGADALILSGDIFVAADIGTEIKHKRIATFLENVCSEFEHVFYVAGNHEHYNGDFTKTYDKIKSTFSYLTNLHILDKETFKLNDFTFVGGTLWTDMNKEDPNTLYSIGGVMNDFRIVSYGGRMKYWRDSDGNSHERQSTLLPEDVVVEHKAMIEVIQKAIADDPHGKFVIIGHHAPSKQSTHPRYKEEVLMNGAYSSDLSEFILDRPQIKLWTHGHTHERFDYNIGSTRIVCNPRGYDGYEPGADLFELQTVEI